VIESRRMIGAGHVARMSNIYKIFVGKPRRKSSSRIPRRIWEDNVRIKENRRGRCVLNSSGSR
jgi:hypothetical protein